MGSTSVEMTLTQTPTKCITLSFLLQGSPWVSRSERRDGRNRATGEIGGGGDRVDGKGLLTGLQDKVLAGENGKGAGVALAITDVFLPPFLSLLGPPRTSGTSWTPWQRGKDGE